MTDVFRRRETTVAQGQQCTPENHRRAGDLHRGREASFAADIPHKPERVCTIHECGSG
jgi:hypothetical protein